jgi:hypothetical protein
VTTACHTIRRDYCMAQNPTWLLHRSKSLQVYLQLHLLSTDRQIPYGTGRHTCPLPTICVSRVVHNNYNACWFTYILFGYCLVNIYFENSRWSFGYRAGAQNLYSESEKGRNVYFHSLNGLPMGITNMYNFRVYVVTLTLINALSLCHHYLKSHFTLHTLLTQLWTRFCTCLSSFV